MATCAILTANIGGIDQVHTPVKQSEGHEFFYYTENNLPFPLPNLDNRMKGKYLKTQSHRFLNHDIFIWIDGGVEIVNDNFIKMIIEQLNGHDLVNTKHYDRNSVYEEMDFIQRGLKEKNPYLLNRYEKEPFDKEREFYIKEKMPKNYQLYNCWFFARFNNPFVNKIFDRWWELCLQYTNFDQTQFSFASWEGNLKINSINVDNYLVRHPHAPTFTIHVNTPFSIKKKLGASYNAVMEKIHEDDWVCFLDHDVLFLTPDTIRHLYTYVAQNSKVGMFTCYCNRVHNLSKEQQLPGCEVDNSDIKYHYQLAIKQQEKLYKTSELKNYNRISGFLMLISKKTWNEVKFSEERDCLWVDTDFCNALAEKKKVIARMDGIYVWHSYRINKDVNDKTHLL